jgi:hypothetical protein
MAGKRFLQSNQGKAGNEQEGARPLVGVKALTKPEVREEQGNQQLT